MTLRIGIFGGTFDPIHNAHLAVANAVANQLELDTVYFVPAGDPYLRRPPVASVGDRAEMVQLAIASHERFVLSLVDAERPGPTYSVDTVRDIKKGLSSDAAIFLIVGADAARQLSRWKSPEILQAEAQLVVVRRPGEATLPDLGSGYPTDGAIYVDSVQSDISATLIRETLAGGRSIADMVPGDVETYIREKQLYEDEET